LARQQPRRGKTL